MARPKVWTEEQRIGLGIRTGTSQHLPSGKRSPLRGFKVLTQGADQPRRTRFEALVYALGRRRGFRPEQHAHRYGTLPGGRLVLLAWQRESHRYVYAWEERGAVRRDYSHERDVRYFIHGPTPPIDLLIAAFQEVYEGYNFKDAERRQKRLEEEYERRNREIDLDIVRRLGR